LQTCTASGFPQAALYWLKDGQPLRTGARVRTVSSERISVTSVAREDRGMYQCFVRNEYEMAQGIAELRLGGEYFWLAFARCAPLRGGNTGGALPREDNISISSSDAACRVR
jgi:hypothetical protein